LGRPTEFTPESFLPVARLVSDPQVLAVKSDSEYKTLDQFVSYLKDHPKGLSVAQVGTLTGDGLTTLKFMKAAGVKVTSVPVSGSADSTKQLLGGHVDAMVGNVGDVTADPDKYNILGVATEKRHPWLPDVPTFKEQGLDLTAAIDRGWGVPKGTPVELRDKIQEAVKTITDMPEYQKDMKKAGLPSAFLPGDEWMNLIKQQKSEAKDILDQFDMLKK
jgi:tripartite-type tricarboxylate transporter receptor subunit TctC